MLILQIHILGRFLQFPSILIGNIVHTLDSMFRIHVSSECITVGNYSAAHSALVWISLSMDNLHMPASDTKVLERLVAQKTLTTTIWSPDNRTYTLQKKQTYLTIYCE